ncbi:MAG: hypothetical protein NTV43_13150 [Methylococcales bacterium]|nr:hypothetical protein [Methylococcales bacterium]
MKLPHLDASAALLGVLALALTGYAAAGQEDWQTKGSDPSEIISRLELRNEYLSLPDGKYLDQVYLRGDYAATENIGFRLDIPLVNGGQEDFANHFGMGNLIVGGRGKIEINEQLSWLVGTNFAFATTSSPQLGSAWNQIIPGTYLVWKPTQQWLLAVGYEYAASFGSSEEEKIGESLFRPGALYHMPYGFWLWLDPKIYVNHVQNGETSLVLEGEFGKVLTPTLEVWLRGGGNVAGETSREERLGWKAEAGIRYLFE